MEEQKKNPKFNFEYIISEKLDGWYIYIDFINGIWEYPRTSSCRILPSLKWLKDKLELLPKPKKDCRLIAEAIIPGLEFSEINGRLNRTLNSYQEKEVVLYFHDLLFFRNPSSFEPVEALARYSFLKSWEFESDTFKVHEILGISREKDHWLHFANQIWENDGEGVVLKQVNGFYYPEKRNSSLMKIKLEETFDLIVVNFTKSIGEKGNIAYNLLVKNKQGVTQNVVVSRHKDILEFENNSPIGKVATIKAMKQNPEGSYREPRFMHLRPDKTEKEID